MDKSLHHHNLENFRKHLAATKDDVQRRMLLTLLAEEEAKERPVPDNEFFGLGALVAGDRGPRSVACARFGSAMFETSLQGSRHRQPELRIHLLPVTLVVEAVVGLTCTM